MSDTSTTVPNGNRPLPTASFALRPEQVEQIRKLAAQRNTSQSAIMREAIDLLMRETVRQAIEQLQQARGAGHPLLPPLDPPTPGPVRRAGRG
jgi:hypothetical protein